MTLHRTYGTRRLNPGAADHRVLEPSLEQDVLRTQSAAVDIVSGAAYTSTGYLNSLQAALDQLS